jgi:hypothetical protein
MTPEPYRELWIERRMAQLRAIPQPSPDAKQEMAILELAIRWRTQRDKEKAANEPTD